MWMPGQHGTTEGKLPVYGAPEGADAICVADAARTRGDIVVHIARDGARAAAMVRALSFFAPDIPVIEFPAWDCLPYDRVFAFERCFSAPDGGTFADRCSSRQGGIDRGDIGQRRNPTNAAA